jgi:type IV secretory pathway protease TraF
MEPGLRHGRIVLFRTSLPGSRYKPGDIVLFNHDGLEKIKRIHTLRKHEGKTEAFLLGDNAENSIDSREFGWIPLGNIRGRILWPNEKNH